MLTDAMVTALEKGGLGAVLMGLLYLASRAIDKYKPTSERRAEELAMQAQQLAAFRDQLAHYRSEVDKLQSDVASLREELRRMSRERHAFYNAIMRCTTIYPDTHDWWQKELSEIETRVRGGGA